MRTLFILFVTFCFSSIHSQVTVGSAIAPIDGALLDLKENNLAGANSTKGLLLPRVSLTIVNTLDDISVLNPSDVTVRQAHTGLSVYNTNAGFTGGVGVNVWDGNEWVNVQEEPILINFNLAGIVNPGASLLSAGLLSPATDWQVFSYSTVLIDTNGEYNATTGVFTAEHNGLYDIKAQISFSDLALATTYGIAIYKKAAAASTYTQLSSQTRSVLLEISVVLSTTQTGVSLNAGDQILFAVRKGTLLNLSVGNNGTSYAVIKEQ